MTARYRGPDAGGLRIVPLDTLHAVYHRASGQTHVVAPPVPEMLVALAGQAMTATELLAALSARYDVRGGDAAAITARLDELVAIGLIDWS